MALSDPCCDKCGLHRMCRSPFMDGDGPENSDQPTILIVGEAPGAQEDARGLPFQGDAGRLLRDALQACDVDLTQVRFTNAVRCRPPDNKITARAVGYCAGFLRDEIDGWRPKVILSLGNSPMRSLTKRGGGILSLRGSVETISLDDGTEIPVVLGLHPAFILRETGKHPLLIQDITKAKEIAQSGVKETAPVDYRVVRTPADFERMHLELQAASRVAWDIETTTLSPFALGAKVLCVQFSTEPRSGWLLPIEHPEECDVLLEDRLAWLKLFLESCDVLRGQNLKFDMAYLEGLYGIRPRRPVFDCYLAHHLLEEEGSRQGANGLKSMAVRYTDMGNYERPLEEKYGGKKDGAGFYARMAEVPLEELKLYAVADTDAVLRVEDVLTPRLVEEGLMPTLALELGKQRFLADMELAGATIDWEFWAELNEALPRQSEDARARLQAFPEVLETCQTLASRKGMKKVPEFNPNSTQHLTALCMETLGFRGFEDHMTDGGAFSVAQPVLQRWLASAGERSVAASILRLILDDKKATKLHSTYVSGLQDKAGSDGRLHVSFLQCVPVTWRISSSPNFQNLPRNDDGIDEDSEVYGKGSIKRMYCAPDPGWVVGEADYAQVELRIAALLSQDPVMLRAIREGVDLHRLLAVLVYNVLAPSPLPGSNLVQAANHYVCGQWPKEHLQALKDAMSEGVPKAQRTDAKRANFGCLYLMTAPTLSATHNIPIKRAEAFVSLFWGVFKGYGRWVNQTKRAVHRNGFSQSLFGHRRHVGKLRSMDPGEVRAAEREAVNAPIQTTASNMALYAGALINQLFREDGMRAHVFNQVHDSLWFASPKDELPRVGRVIKTVMENLPFDFLVPGKVFQEVPRIDAEFKIGPNMGALEAWEP